MTASYSGHEFEKALTAGKLKAPLVRFGMAKPSETPGYILFAEGDCNNWIKIPTHMIENVVNIAATKCRDHEHPFVQIEFKEPNEGDEVAKVFAELLRQQSSGLAHAGFAAHPATIESAGNAQGQGAPGSAFSFQNRSGIGIGGGGLIPEDCFCNHSHMECSVVWVRFGSGRGSIRIPMPVCRWVCDSYDCSKDGSGNPV